MHFKKEVTRVKGLKRSPISPVGVLKASNLHPRLHIHHQNWRVTRRSKNSWHLCNHLSILNSRNRGISNSVHQKSLPLPELTNRTALHEEFRCARVLNTLVCRHISNFSAIQPRRGVTFRALLPKFRGPKERLSFKKMQEMKIEWYLWSCESSQYRYLLNKDRMS